MIEVGPRPAPAEIRLRPGGANDLDEVMRIMSAAFEPCYGEAWTRSQCAGILPMKGVALALAEQGGTAVGFALMRIIADEAELLLLAVAPESQGKGVGRTILAHFVDTAHDAGAQHLHLEVRDGNAAVALYHKAGFRPAGRRLSYYKGAGAQRHDALTLVLTD